MPIRFITKREIGIYLGLIFLSCNLFAEVRLHNIFADHMVLQRDQIIKVYGFGDNGEDVTVLMAGQTVSTVVQNGKWMLSFKPTQAGGPYTLVVKGGNTLTLKDILFGDVWICTGQSNMATDIRYYKKPHHGVRFEEYDNLPGSFKNHNIRLIRVNQSHASTPQDQFIKIGKWGVCEGDNIKDFSAVGFFFGKHLQPELGIPIGLIMTTVGGTQCEFWMSKDKQSSFPEGKKLLDDYDRYMKNEYAQLNKTYLGKLQEIKNGAAIKRPAMPMGPNHIRRPNALYNAMIHPLHDFSIKGAIWYQGEGNAGRFNTYQAIFTHMIEEWRERWGQGDFPFLFVQLASWKPVVKEPSNNPWANLRDAQLQTWKAVPNTGMAVAIDGGLTKDIHPPQKEPVGERLATMALGMVYKKTKIYSGPLYRDHSVQGKRIVLNFDHLGGGLITKDVLLDKYGPAPFRLSKEKLYGFTIAGADGKFYRAEAQIINGKQIEVWSSKVKAPKAVRYAWEDFPLVNLYNKENLPAVPFKTDNCNPASPTVDGIAVGKSWICIPAFPNHQKNIWAGLTDGDTRDGGSTAWASADGMTFPKNVTIDLEDKYDLSSIKIHNSKTGGTKDLEVWVSQNNIDFTFVGEHQFKEHSDEVWGLIASRTEGRYVKIIFLSAHERGMGNGFCMLTEVEIQGELVK
jgi:sialate O-acetylesterase